jgi:hypothetical protein
MAMMIQKLDLINKAQQINPQVLLSSPILAENHSLLHQRLSEFLTISGIFDETNENTQQTLPDVLLMDKMEFNKKMAEYEVRRLNVT